MGFRRNIDSDDKLKGERERERERERDGERQAGREGGAYHLYSSLKLGDLISTCRVYEN